MQKTKKFHACRKLCCEETIENVNTLLILEFLVSNKYNWKDHIFKLKSSILTRPNIIQYLSSKSFVHINTLTYLTKTLILRKIDYCLFIYGNSCKSNINIIKPAYHRAARACVYAFRTTPIENILREANFATITDRIYELKSRILPKLINSTNSVLNSIISANKSKRIKRLCQYSALSLSLCTELSITLILTKKHIKEPPWKLETTCLDSSFTTFSKNNSHKNIFFNLLQEQISFFKSNNWPQYTSLFHCRRRWKVIPPGHTL